MKNEILHKIKVKELAVRANLNYKIGNRLRGDYLASEIVTETLMYNFKRYAKSLG